MVEKEGIWNRPNGKRFLFNWWRGPRNHCSCVTPILIVWCHEVLSCTYGCRDDDDVGGCFVHAGWLVGWLAPHISICFNIIPRFSFASTHLTLRARRRELQENNYYYYILLNAKNFCSFALKLSFRLSSFSKPRILAGVAKNVRSRYTMYPKKRFHWYNNGIPLPIPIFRNFSRKS